MDENAERFISAYNQIDHYLRELLPTSYHPGFSQLVRQAAQQHMVFFIKFKDDLLEYAELRNAIVHSRNHGKVLASPLNDVVLHIEYIRDLLFKPRMAGEVFKRERIWQLHTHDTLDKALVLLKNHKISQIPVLHDNTIVDVLNTNTVVYWLAEHYSESVLETPLSNVLPYKEHNRNFYVVSEKTDVFEVASLFLKHYHGPHCGRYPEAVLVTRNGNYHERITGMCVLEDIAQYL